MTERKTVGQRIAGYSKSARIEAKFFLFALAPFVLLMISDELGWSRGAVWHGWFWLCATWAVFVLTNGFAAMWRALRRSTQRKR